MKNADNLGHNFWTVSENLKALRELLSNFNARLDTLDDGNYSKTKAHDVVFLIEGLLPNIESLIEAAKAIQSVARPTAGEILTASIALNQNILNCKREIQNRCLDNIDTSVRVNSPEYIYKRVIKRIRDTTGKCFRVLEDLRYKVDAESKLEPIIEQQKATGKAEDKQVWPQNGFMNFEQLCKQFSVPDKNKQAFRKRLERFRKKNTLNPSAFTESQNKGTRQSKYLYSVAMVDDIAKGVKGREVSLKHPSGKKTKKI